MARRLGSAYLWVALFPAIPVGRLRGLIGVEALICGYAVFVALTAAGAAGCEHHPDHVQRRRRGPGELHRGAEVVTVGPVFDDLTVRNAKPVCLGGGEPLARGRKCLRRARFGIVADEGPCVPA
jgi:hypothetical protein